MFCKKCGNPLPKEGYICVFCGAMMTKEQIEMQKKLMQENKYKVELKTQDFNQDKLNIEHTDDKKENKLIPILIILGIIIFLIVFAILLNVG